MNVTETCLSQVIQYFYVVTDFVKTLHKNSEHLYMKPLIRFVLFVLSLFDASNSEDDTLVEINEPHQVIHYLNSSQNIYHMLSFSIKNLYAQLQMYCFS